MNKKNVKNMLDEFMEKEFVPDVYQPDIFAINYERLKYNGIKLLSFDIDETITSKYNLHPSKRTILLFEELKKDFEIVLLTNNNEARAKTFSEDLGVEKYIARAKKPSTRHFQEIQDENKIDKGQMAHIGNSIINDVGGGNVFEITTCLVKPKGKRPEKPDDKLIKEELKSRDIWRAHHKYSENDQYYQLGQKPKYRDIEMAKKQKRKGL